MQFMIRKLKKRFAEVGRQEGKDPIIIAKYFYPFGSATWYATEYYPKERIFFGYASIFGVGGDEWGYFSIDEMRSFKDKFGIGIERDLYWIEQKASVILGKEKVPWV